MFWAEDGGDHWQVLGLIFELVDKWVLIRESRDPDTVRYRMLAQDGDGSTWPDLGVDTYPTGVAIDDAEMAALGSGSAVDLTRTLATDGDTGRGRPPRLAFPGQVLATVSSSGACSSSPGAAMVVRCRAGVRVRPGRCRTR